jgi:hypothetical protein
MSSYTLGELHGLVGIVHYRLGIPVEAEFHAHRCLSQLRPDQHHNRAYYRAQTALAQLAQDDVEQALAAAVSVPPGGPWRPQRTDLPHPGIIQLGTDPEGTEHYDAPRLERVPPHSLSHGI